MLYTQNARLFVGSASADSLSFGRAWDIKKFARDKNRVPYMVMVNNRVDCLVY